MMQPERALLLARSKQRFICGLTLALAYAITGRLALLLAMPPGYATAVFPPSGIAIAASLIGGRAVLPWVFAGSFALNLSIGSTVDGLNAGAVAVIAVVIAAASTAQAAVGAWSLRRFIGYPLGLDNIRDLARFLLISPAVCTCSVTLSLGGLVALGGISLPQLGPNWFAWWIGDTLGVLFFLPLMMVLAGEPRPLWRSRARNVAVPMLLFFSLFLAIFVRTRESEQDQSLAEFKLLTQGFLDRLQFQLTAQEDLLRQLGAFWQAQDRITRKEFGALTSHLL